MSTAAPPGSFSAHRKQLLAASIPAAATSVFIATLGFEALLGIASPERLRLDWLPNTIQLLVPVAAWIVGRGALRARPEAVLLAADLAYTGTLIARLALPVTSVSGTALYVAVKMMVTALLVPWGPRRQVVSVSLTLAMMYLALMLTQDHLISGPSSHLWVGPLVAGFLSIVGAGVGDRVRRAVFERERELRAAAEHLRQEMEVDEALARVGRELIALPDTRRILDALCRLTTEVLGCDASHTYLLDGERQEYVVAAGYGDAPEQWEALRLVRYPLALTQGFQVRLEAAGVEQYFLDESPPQPLATLRQFDASVVLCVALGRGDKQIGVLTAEQRGRGQAFTAEQLRIARGMAHLASLALETARLVEELEGANRIKSEFVATMSHELRSPLNVIIGYHELLLDGGFGPLTAPQREPLRRADRSARELLDLISATLDLSRLEAKRVPIDREAVDVRTLLDEVGQELGDLAERANLRVEWQAGDDIPTLWTDRVKLKMVLKNLVTNAVKFTEQGRVLVTAAAKGSKVEMTVSDTGIGIPADAQAMIFEPFRQLDVDRARLRAGAGLGLYIVKQLLTVLGGSIALESEVGRGSTFRVELPFDASATPAAAPPREAGPTHQRPFESAE